MKENFDYKEFKAIFPGLTEEKIALYDQLFPLYQFWNQRINVISPKDIEHLYIRHILHSLAIAKVDSFKKDEKIIDVGTGGGFPGIPLAIMFPESQFTLIDSIGKKVKVVDEIAKELKLTNVFVQKSRSNELKGHFDCITGRAVTAFPLFYEQVKHLISKGGKIFYLKGGDFENEITNFKNVKIFQISLYFNYEYFETKKLIYFTKN